MSEPSNVKPRAKSIGRLDDRTLFRVVIALWAVAAVWKLILAFTANVTLSEAELAVLGLRPALAYPGMPGGLPLLAAAFTRLFGWSATALRGPGLALAMTFAPAVYWTRRAEGTQRAALWAVCMALLCPPFSLFGVVFGPGDAVPTAFAVALGAAMRARRGGAPQRVAGYWALAAVGLMLGLFFSGRWMESLLGWLTLLTITTLLLLILFGIGRLTEKAANRRRAILTSVGATFGLLIALGETALVATWAHANATPPPLRPLLVGRLEDWSRMTAPVDQALDFARARFPGSQPVIVAPDNATALRLEFPGHRGRRVYVLNNPDASPARKAWGLDEAALKRDHAGGAALLVLPGIGAPSPDETAFRSRLCRMFDRIHPAGFSQLPPRRVTVRLYTARIASPGVADTPAGACPLLPASQTVGSTY